MPIVVVNFVSKLFIRYDNLLALKWDDRIAGNFNFINYNIRIKKLFLPFRERFPLREKLLQRGWPSTWCPSEPSCSPDRPSVGCGGSSRVCERSGYLRVYPFWTIEGKNWSKIFKNTPEKDFSKVVYICCQCASHQQSSNWIGQKIKVCSIVWFQNFIVYLEVNNWQT